LVPRGSAIAAYRRHLLTKIDPADALPRFSSQCVCEITNLPLQFTMEFRCVERKSLRIEKVTSSSDRPSASSFCLVQYAASNMLIKIRNPSEKRVESWRS